MARSSRLYVPISVAFLDDDRILTVGEGAAWLYLAILLKAKTLGTDGVLTSRQIERLAVADWADKLGALCAVELVTKLPKQPGAYAVSAWLKWNDSAAERDKHLAAERERKAAARRKAEPEAAPKA